MRFKKDSEFAKGLPKPVWSDVGQVVRELRKGVDTKKLALISKSAMRRRRVFSVG